MILGIVDMAMFSLIDKDRITYLEVNEKERDGWLGIDQYLNNVEDLAFNFFDYLEP